MSIDFNLEIPPLDSSDERLVDAYRTVGKPIDQLPYTADFDRLRTLVGVEPTDDARHQLFLRLLRLRKTGRLPSLSLIGD